MPALTDQRLSHLDLYFFTPMGVSALEPAHERLSPLITPRHGPGWWSDLGSASAAYRGAVDTLLRERAETGESLLVIDKILARVSPWRRVMENAARRAPAPRRRTLLRAAGYGLGTVRSVKDAKDFLVEVQHHVALHDDELEALGVANDARAFPSTALVALEEQANAIAKEKAEDKVAADLVNEARGRLLPFFDTAWLAVEGEIAAAEFAGDAEHRQTAAAVLAGLEAALAEARVASQKRASEGGVPVGLVDDGADGAAGGGDDVEG